MEYISSDVIESNGVIYPPWDADLVYDGVQEILVFNHLCDRNAFVDCDGEYVINITEHIHPQDVLRFRRDPGDCYFPHRFHKNIFVEVVAEEDNPWYHQWKEDVNNAKNRWDINSEFCSGGLCWVLSDSGLSREDFGREICSTCGARDGRPADLTGEI